MLTKPLVTGQEALAFCEAGQTLLEMFKNLAFVATRDIERETGRFFTKQTHSQIFTARQTKSQRYDWGDRNDWSPTTYSGLVTSGKGQTVLLSGVAVDPESIEVWYDPSDFVFGDTTKLEATKDFVVTPEEPDAVYITYPTDYAPRSIKVSYSFGFEPSEAAGEETLSASAPADLKHACLMQIAHLRTRSKPDNIGMTGERRNSGKDRSAEFQWSVSGGLSPEVQAIVRDYYRLKFGSE